MLGNHVIKTWSSTQAVIALSSGEAEYYGIVKGGTMGLGARSEMEDLGYTARIVIRTDASAAKGIANRRGLGKVRHIDTRELWMQEKVGNGDLEVEKVKGTENVADALTKYVDQGKLRDHMIRASAIATKDRHELAPDVDPCAVDDNTGIDNAEEEHESSTLGSRKTVYTISGSRQNRVRARWADVDDSE